MQKIRFTIAVIVGIMAYNVSQAQNLDVANLNAPKTIVTATIVVEKEVIKKGTYARFAQKYLGVIAPLSDKTIYSIKLGSLDSRNDNEARPNQIRPANLAIINDRHTNPADTAFAKLPADKLSSAEMSVEDMAAAAANKIFTLRKRRFDLITGEAGENVFGEGLGAAIAEMKRLEDEYISLFVGKQYTVLTVKSYDIIPQSDKTTVVVCRFSPAKGLLPDNDLSAAPITLQMSYEKSPETDYYPKKESKDKRPTVTEVIPASVECKLSDANNVLDVKRFPIYQFGKTVEIPMPYTK